MGQAADRAVAALEPGNGWMSESTLKSMWIDARAAHVEDDPFTVDALLYSSNAIFSLTRKRSNSDGQLTVNGAILASDVGILAAGGLQINHDVTVGDLLDVKRYDAVAFSHTLTVSEVNNIE